MGKASLDYAPYRTAEASVDPDGQISIGGCGHCHTFYYTPSQYEDLYGEPDPDDEDQLITPARIAAMRAHLQSMLEGLDTIERNLNGTGS